MPGWAWVIVGLGVLLGVSFFFALAESALFSLGQWRLRRLVEQAPVAGARVERLLASPHDLLATLVLGNSFANASAVALVLWVVLEQGWAPGSMVWTMLGVFAILLTLGEVLPKTLAVRSPERWSVRVARPMAWLVWVLRPGHRIAQGWVSLLLRGVRVKYPPGSRALSDEEYQELTEMAWQSGTLADTEREMILGIMQLDQRTAKDVMRPRAQMACIPDDLSVEAMLDAARRARHRRIPVYDEDPETIVGVLNTRVLLLDPTVDLEEAIEFPSFVPETMNLLQLFKSLQRQRRGMAIVLDEYGGAAGLVTLEDILESMVGELGDELEEQGFLMERQGEGRWRVNARLRLDDFRREHPALQDVPEVETLGGLVVHLSERVPPVGQVIVHQGLKLTVLASDHRRVKELRVELVARKGGRGV